MKNELKVKAYHNKRNKQITFVLNKHNADKELLELLKDKTMIKIKFLGVINDN